MSFKVFQNKISTVALFLMIAFYVIMTVRTIFVSFFEPPAVPKQALTINKVELVQNVIKPGQTLVERVDAIVNIKNCDSYILRNIVEKKSGTQVWFSVIELTPRGTLEKLVDEKIITVKIPELSPGEYIYRSEIHEVCGPNSYVAIVPLQNFRVE